MHPNSEYEIALKLGPAGDAQEAKALVNEWQTQARQLFYSKTYDELVQYWRMIDERKYWVDVDVAPMHRAVNTTALSDLVTHWYDRVIFSLV